LRNLVQDHHPSLLEELRAAGCQEMKFADGLPAASKDRYRPEPGDEILTVITSRRTTLELVIRRYVERMPGVDPPQQRQCHRPAGRGRRRGPLCLSRACA
jgi:hypothetical protein